MVNASRRRKGMTLEASYSGRRFMIEEDSSVGFYLYVFEGQRCTQDYLQDTLAGAKKFALDKFNVPYNVWTEATSTI
jgi:hypothetical protein